MGVVCVVCVMCVVCAVCVVYVIVCVILSGAKESKRRHGSFAPLRMTHRMTHTTRFIALLPPIPAPG
jgi:hypothetical protein